METFTINDCDCIDIFIALPDFLNNSPLNAIVDGYFEARFIGLSDDLQFADEEVYFNALHDGE